MSLILRLRHHLSKGFPSKPIAHPLAVMDFLNLKGAQARGFAQPQPARQVDDGDEEEVEIDQRRLPADYDPAIFDPTEHRSPPTELVFMLVDEISSLTLMEIAELGSIIMKKKGMTKPPVSGVMKAGAVGLAMKAPSCNRC